MDMQILKNVPYSVNLHSNKLDAVLESIKEKLLEDELIDSIEFKNAPWGLKTFINDHPRSDCNLIIPYPSNELLKELTGKWSFTTEVVSMIKEEFYKNLNLNEAVSFSDKKDPFKSGEVKQTLQCKICGGDEFQVGIGDYWTQIRCKKCEIETCVHEG